MRLGEILIRDRMITPAQLDSAVQAQMLYGGRLGTNLVELGFVDLDTVARALAKQQGVPAALQRHFDSIAAHAVKLVPAGLAQKTLSVPLGVLEQGGRRELWMALVDPHHPTAEKEIAFATGARVMVAVAPELRIHFQLERLYKIQRDQRFMRVAPSTSKPPRAERRRVAAPRDEWKRDEITIGGVLSRLPQKPPQGVITSATPAHGARIGKTTTVNGPMAVAEAAFRKARVEPGLPVAVPPPASAEPEPSPLPTPTVMGRSPALPVGQRAAAGLRPPAPASAPPPPTVAAATSTGRPALGAADVLERLAQPGVDREEIGELVLDFLRSSFGAGVIFIVRQDLALAWKGFAPGVDPGVFEALSLPLSSPSAIQLAHRRGALFRGAPPAEGALLDGRLWKLLKSEPPREVAVLPIVIKSRVVNLIYVHALGGGLLADATLVDLSRVASAAGEAFLRLIGQKHG